MKKLSSKSTFFYKGIIPAIWFGFLGLVVLTLIFGSGRKYDPGIVFFVIPIFLAAFGYFIMKRQVFDLADEVYDEGSTVLFKNKGKEVRVNLKDIKNVSYSAMMSPPRVTLSIRYKTELGDELSFSAPMSFIPFKKNSDIEELIDRIDRARG